jgi:hypothetical protein
MAIRAEKIGVVFHQKEKQLLERAFGFFGKVGVSQDRVEVGVLGFLYERKARFKGAFPGNQVIPGESFAALYDLADLKHMVHQDNGNQNHPKAHLRGLDYCAGQVRGKSLFIFPNEGSLFAQ